MNGASIKNSGDRSDYWKDDFTPLQQAGKSILKVLRNDENSSHADLYRRILTSAASESDLFPTPNHHYFANDAVNETPSTGQWSHVHSIPVPPFIQEQLNKTKMSTLMGLFPQAELAWMTIDDTIYLWSYKNTQADLLYFQVPSHQPIVSVGLAPPKQGVFREMVEWCLVVTTKEEAMLCALARKDTQQGFTVVRTKFVVPSDWISFLSVTSTQDGRIFLGGQDGNLYELDYDLLVQAHYANDAASNQPSTEQQLDDFYNGPSGVCPPEIVEQSSKFDSLFSTGKRAMTSLLPTSRDPPRKCRKINHSQSSFSNFVPDLIQNLTSAIFGGYTTTGAGPIIQMVVDDERQILYTLSSRGWICALDIAEKPHLKLTSVLNTPATARLYLEAVSRGRMYPPSTSGANQGELRFPGGGEAAQAGVGGMEGARQILKLAEAAKSAHRRRSPNVHSLLTPVSIQVIPNRESTRITLLAITAGGLRYYLSSLSPRTLGSGPASTPFGTPRSRHPWKPHSKMTLCHIRAPPPVTNDNPATTSTVPTAPKDQRVDASCYRLGAFFAAFQKTNDNNSGNILVVASTDAVARIREEKKKDNQTTITYIAPGGICEVVSFPMTMDGLVDNQPIMATLPGGRIWDIAVASMEKDKVLSLALQSKTPTDTELGIGMVPAYVPPSKKRTTKPKPSTTSDSSALANPNSGSMYTMAFTMITNVMLSRPARYGLNATQPKTTKEERPVLYQISQRSGTEQFSLSAAEKKSNVRGTATRSARLSPWLLKPDVVPLSPLALQYLERPSTNFMAINAGGLHSFQSPSLLQQLSAAILDSGANVRSDPNVTKFFQDYGYSEGCAMCLLLAMKPSSSSDLKEFALRAALARAYRPSLVSRSDDSGSMDHSHEKDPWIPSGYSFTPSALFQGLTVAVARLLRPIWYKPAVVVTEGRVLKRGGKSKTTPAKVELLLEDDALEEIRKPLLAMQRVLSRVFGKAVGHVPQSKNTSADQMDVDDDNHYLSRALEYQRSGQAQNTANTILRATEAEELAQHLEERNIHSLYRLLSRAVQLLSLFSHLRRAHAMPDLPEVEWGLLHGISVAQFVQTREGQERLESMLNSLIAASTPTNTSAPTISADANGLARQLSQECYHFFSPGSRYAYFGFQHAHEALNLPVGQSRRSVRAREAVEYLKQAAQSWFSPSLITGRLLHAKESENDSDKIAERALQFDSPLAKACTLLVELGDVASLVEICLLTASNFAPTTSKSLALVPIVDVSENGWGGGTTNALPWEKGLYHKRQEAPNSSTSSSASSSAVALGASVTAKDAVDTCHALVFHHLSKLLNSPISTLQYELGEKMVSVCSASTNEGFLHAFFSHLLNRNHTDVLLRIDSRVLESWLSEKQKEQPDLLLRYFQIQDRNEEAGNVAWSRAHDSSLELELTVRMECLVHAVDAYSRAISKRQGDSRDLQGRLKQVETSLKISRMQGRILQQIANSKFVLSEEDLKRLRGTLVDANILLNKYAIPFEMFDVCLLVMDICEYDDTLHVQQFWKSLLCEEVFPCETHSEQVYRNMRGFAEGSMLDNPTITLLSGGASAKGSLFESGDWLKRAEDTVVRLGRQVYSSGENYVFLVDYIVGCLEELRRIYASAVPADVASQTLGWPYTTLVSAGVEHLVAVRAYEQIIDRESHVTMGGVDPRRRLEQLQTLIAMLEAFESAARSGSQGSDNAAYQEMANAYASGSLLAGIEDYKSRLQALPGDVSNEESRLAALEASVRRLYG